LEETKQIFNRRRPTLVRFVSRAADKGNVKLLSLLVVAPVLCQINQVD
jgi:hypothetical protein